MKTILCFGDSNTWGSIASDRPTVQPSLRYDEHTRWPCVLGEELGPEYRVVEEGLSGRTTIYSIPSEAYKNGEPYLLPCLLSHRPLDLVIMMLGTNDLRLVYHADYDHLDKGIRRLIEIVQTCSMCGVGAVSPRSCWFLQSAFAIQAAAWIFSTIAAERFVLSGPRAILRPTRLWRGKWAVPFWMLPSMGSRIPPTGCTSQENLICGLAAR